MTLDSLLESALIWCLFGKLILLQVLQLLLKLPLLILYPEQLSQTRPVGLDNLLLGWLWDHRAVVMVVAATEEVRVRSISFLK